VAKNKRWAFCWSCAIGFCAFDCRKRKSEVSLSCQSYNDYKDGRNAHQYVYDKTTGLLKDNNPDNVDKYPIQIDPSGTESYFGPFFSKTLSNLQKLTCDYDDSQLCPWQVYSSLDTFYQYQSGPYSQQVSLVASSGKVVNFEQPMAVMGTFSGHDSPSGKDYDGSKILLTYYGQAALDGFPTVCLDRDTLEAGTCNQNTDSYNDVSLPSDLVLTDLDGNQYYAKPEVVYEFYKPLKRNNKCSTLLFADMPVKPDFNDIYEDPENLNGPYVGDDERILGSYFRGGSPAAVAGITAYELAEK